MKRLHLFITASWLGIMASGCTKDHVSTPEPPDGETAITLTLNVPGIDAPVSRTLSGPDESRIDRLDVLVFEVNGTAEKYLYATHGSVIDADGGAWRVQLQISKHGEAHRLVLLANLSDAVEAAYQGGEFTPGRDKEELLATIMFDASGAWDTTTPDYLPMWGESEPIVVGRSGPTSIPNIRMLRSVARIDLVLNPDALGAGQGFSYFKLDEVKVYNVSEKGYAVPDPDNVTAFKATAPTVSPSVARTARSYPLDAGQKLKGLVRNIYIAEADNNIAGMDYAEQTCLVISAYYRDDLVATWYRIDLQSFTPPGNFRHPQEPPLHG